MDSRSRRSFRTAAHRNRKPFFESLEKRVVLDGSPWNNELNVFDVDHDGRANAIDRSTLSNFLYRTPGRSGPVSVPPSPDPNSDVIKFYDVDADLLVDQSDLAGLTDFLLGNAASDPVPPGASGPDSVEPLGEGGGEGESGPSGSPPSVWLTGSAYIVEGETSPNAFLISRSGNTSAGLTVNFTINGASTASPGDYTSSILSAGSVTFTPGQTQYYIPVTALDDTLLENSETLGVILTPSSAYYIASGPAQTEIHDGEHGLIDTDFSAEWEDEDAWKSVPRDDMLWDDVTHRWRANIPSQLVGLVGMVTWYRRPHSNPLEPWEEFAGSEYSSSAVEYVATGYPGVGHWDIMYRATYGLLSWFQAVEYDWAGNGISGVSWGPGNPGQKMRNLGNEIEVFPELTLGDDNTGYNEVEVHVVLLASVPAGKSAQVKLKVFDPDHPHTKTAEEAWWPSIESFDPNDVYDTSKPPDEAITLSPKDNRKSAGGLVGDDAGGTLLPDVLTFPGSGNPFDPPSFHQFTRFRIDEPQPGNNFVAVAGPVRPGVLSDNFVADEPAR